MKPKAIVLVLIKTCKNYVVINKEIQTNILWIHCSIALFTSNITKETGICEKISTYR